MSHRTHHGRLAEQHTERVFWKPVVLALLALAVGCAVAALTGCSVTHGRLDTSAGMAPPGQDPSWAARLSSLAPIPPGQASCQLSGSFTSLNFLMNTNIAALDQRANPDGTTDTRSLNVGRQIDPAAGQAIGGLISLGGMALKGGAKVATGGVALMPQRDGSFRLVPASAPAEEADLAPPPEAWKPASAAGCVPAVSGPAGSVGGGQTRAAYLDARGVAHSADDDRSRP